MRQPLPGSRLTPALRSACVAGLVSAVALCPAPAWAAPTDGTLTLHVVVDLDADGVYDPEADLGQPGVEVVVTDATGTTVNGTTDDTGTFTLAPTEELVGGRYFLTATVPDDLVLQGGPESADFAPLSTTVDVTSDDRELRMSLVSAATPALTEDPTPTPEPEPSTPPPSAPEPSTEPTPEPRFAVGDRVFADATGSGEQRDGAAGLAGVTVQLLDADGSVLSSTTTSGAGRYAFDDLPAGTYAVRFAGLPAESVFSPPGAAAAAQDSDADAGGTTAPFVLAPGEPGVQVAESGDGLRADYVKSDVDAGVRPLRYAVGSVVWSDLDGDGESGPDEPAASARVMLQDAAGAERAVRTDLEGRFLFADLPAGRYRLHFDELGDHRRLTTARRAVGVTGDSDADPHTGWTRWFSLGQGAGTLIPADDFGAVDADYVEATVTAGVTPSFSIANRVWHDLDGDGVADPGEPGIAGLTVELHDAGGAIVASTVTDEDGRYQFDGLVPGSYRLYFPKLPTGLAFTRPRSGADAERDSDVYGDSWTAVIELSDAHPAESTVAAGLTSVDNVTASGTTAPPSPQQPSTQAAPVTPSSAVVAPTTAPTGSWLPWLLPVGSAAAALVGAGLLLGTRLRRQLDG